MDKSNLKFAIVYGLLVTSYISFTIAFVNIGFSKNFIYTWLRSWTIAFILVVPSLLFLAPYVRGKQQKVEKITTTKRLKTNSTTNSYNGFGK